MRVSRNVDPDRAARPLVAVAHDYPSGGSAPRHSHQRAQVIFVSLGAVRLETDEGLWIAPPGRAVWIPGNTTHRADYTVRSSICVAYVDTTAFEGLPGMCAVFALTGLLRELVIRAIDLGWN